ncbi:MAG: hypothetical protein H7196_03430 [candidate division SR1 bacterium]|nr:hypothetical protein [candidate division SR1 bacterium]
MTTIALYSTSNSAQMTYDKLIESGISTDNISVASRDPEKKNMNSDVKVQKDNDTSAADITGGATSGLVTGAAIGFLAGAAALAIPGFGALLVTGPLAAALGGSALAANTALGATIGATGGLVSGLVKAGVDRTQAEEIEKNLQQGGIMIAIKDDEISTYSKILEESNPESLVRLNG